MGTTTSGKTAASVGQTVKIGRRFGAWHWCSSLAGITLSLALYAAPEAPRSVPGQILIKPRVSLSESNLTVRLKELGAAHRKKLRHLNVRVITVAEGKTETVLAALRKDPDIEFAEPDYIAKAAFLPNDPYVLSGDEWHLAQIQAMQAWDVTTGSTNVVIAVIDSGVNSANPDLTNQILPGYNFDSGNSDTSDDFGHGTAVAGTVVAAGNNAIGVAGVAYGCTVLPVKVMGTSGSAAYSTVAEGIEYAVSSGARIINLSLAGSSSSVTLQDAINDAWSSNVVVVAAAGNNANNVPQYPAACSNVVAVAATATDDSLSWFSSYGSFLTLSAPGEDIWTTQNDPLNPYGPWYGTSFASPVVAGVAALVASANPTLSNTQIVEILEQTADDLGPAGYDESFGYGRVNAFRAVSVASGEAITTPPASTLPPSVIVTNPPDNAQFTTNAIALSGVALDNVQVDYVLVKLNSGSFQSAAMVRPKPNTANWIMPVTLAGGTNIVQVKAVDSFGNESALISRSLFLHVTSQLTVQTDGTGSVKPNLDGANLLVGRTYNMTALPGLNWLFTNWVSIVDGVTNIAANTAKITFPMQTNLTLIANFVTNSFIDAAGTYYGLFSDTNNGISQQSAGLFKLSTTKKQKFSGQLWLDGDMVRFSGTFDLSGVGSTTVSRNGKSPLTLTVQLALDGSDRVAGVVSNATDGWSSVLLGNRAVFKAANPAVNFSGRYTMLLPPDTNAEVAPGGDGYGLISIALNGNVTISGALGDGEPLKPKAAPVSENGDYPLYAPAYGSEGLIMGWVNFTNAPARTLTGNLVWIKPVGTDGFYDAGFANEVALVGSGYTIPVAGQPTLLMTNGVIVLTDGNLPEPITNWLTFSNVNTVTMVTTNALMKKPTFTRGSGLMKDKFIHPANPGMWTVMAGVYLQNQNYVGGYFKGTNQTGSLLLQER